MKKLITISFLTIFVLLCFSVLALPTEDKIAALKDEISSLEKQKEQLDTKKQKLVEEGDELSYKIEELKIQAKSGLGIIGKYRLSRNLRKAQKLSEEIQDIERQIYSLEGQINKKKSELVSEYEKEITRLMQKLNGEELASRRARAVQADERKAILETIKEYQKAKDRLTKLEEEDDELERFDVAKVEIKAYDGPQEIREKADLINDFAKKLTMRINMIDSRIQKLTEEIKTRKKLSEFAQEISFFGDRVSKSEIAGKPDDDQVKDDGKNEILTAGDDGTERDGTFGIDRSGDAGTLTKGSVTAEPDPGQPSASVKVMKSNGVLTDFAGMSPNGIGDELKLLEKEREELKKELSLLTDKAKSFYKKADEIEKSETKAGEKKR